MPDSLTEANFLLYAAKMYDNPGCLDTEEFVSDLKRFKYLKRLFNKYRDSGELKERLILNHIIIIYNVFGVEAATRMLFFRLPCSHKYLKSFLLFLGYLPTKVTHVGNDDKTIDCDDILTDDLILTALRRL